MRLISETIGNCSYLDLLLTEDEYDRLKMKGICTEFIGTKLEEKYLNIFIRKEGCEKFYAVEEGEVKPCGFRKRERIDGVWKTTETGCIDQLEESWESKEEVKPPTPTSWHQKIPSMWGEINLEILNLNEEISYVPPRKLT